MGWEGVHGVGILLWKMNISVISLFLSRIFRSSLSLVLSFSFSLPLSFSLSFSLSLSLSLLFFSSLTVSFLKWHCILKLFFSREQPNQLAYEMHLKRMQVPEVCSKSFMPTCSSSADPPKITIKDTKGSAGTSINFPVGGKVEFVCEADAVPAVLSFNITYTKLRGGGKKLLAEINGKTYTSAAALTASDSGWYSCSGMNYLGSSTSPEVYVRAVGKCYLCALQL